MHSAFLRLAAALATRVAPALVLALVWAGPVLAQSRIEGVVKTLKGEPMVGASVVMEVPGLKKSASTVTDSDGRFAFEDVKAGIRVHLIVAKGGQEILDTYALVSLWVERIELQEREVNATGATSYDVLAQRGTGAELNGVVRDSRGQPVQAARVTLNRTTLSSTTDSGGRYAFGGIRTGIPVELNVSASGYKPTTVKVEKTTPATLRSDVVLETAPGFETAGADVAPIDTGADGNRSIVRPAQSAGYASLNRGDVFRGLQFLPDVLGSVERNGSLYVRGASPDQTLVSLDGITLYPASHMLQDLGLVNAGTIKRAVFSDGVTGAADAGRLGSALRLTQQPDGASPAGGYVDFSAFGPSAVFNLPVGSKGAVMVAARRSLTGAAFDDVLGRFLPNIGASVSARTPVWRGGAFAADPVSSYHEENVKADFLLTSRDRVSFTFFNAMDNLNRSHDLAVSSPTSVAAPSSYDLTLPADPVVQNSSIEHWTSSGFGASWSHAFSSRGGVKVSFGRSDQTRDTDFASMLVSQSTGADYSFLAKRGGSNASVDTNHLVDTTFRLDAAMVIGFRNALTAGAELSSVDADYTWQREVFSATKVNGPYSSALQAALARSTSGSSTAFFVEDAIRPFSKLVVTPGVRMAHFGQNASWYLDPRVSAMYQLTPWIRLKGGASIDHQMVNRIVREDRQQGDAQFWTVADGTVVRVPRSAQFTGGFAVDSGNTQFEISGYRTNLEDLTLFAPRLVTGVAPKNVNNLFYYGTGTASGASVLLQNRNDRNTFWMSYHYGLSEYKYPTLEAKAFPASFDRKNEFKVSDSIQLTSFLTLTGAWTVATGLPTTPSSGTSPVWFANGATVYDIVFADKNSERLPAYQRLDLTAQYDFRIKRAKSTFGVSVLNVTNWDNFGGYRYQNVGDLMKVDTLYLMGRAVNVFARIGF